MANKVYLDWGKQSFIFTLVEIDEVGNETVVELTGQNLQKVLGVAGGFFKELEEQAKSASVADFTSDKVTKAEVEMLEDGSGKMTSTKVRYWCGATTAFLNDAIVAKLNGKVTALHTTVVESKKAEEAVVADGKSLLAALEKQRKSLDIDIEGEIRPALAKLLRDKVEEHIYNDELLEAIYAELEVKEPDSDEGKKEVIENYAKHIETNEDSFGPPALMLFADLADCQILLLSKEGKINAKYGVKGQTIALVKKGKTYVDFTERAKLSDVILKQFCQDALSWDDASVIKAEFLKLKDANGEAFGKLCGFIYTQEKDGPASGTSDPCWAENFVLTDPNRLKGYAKALLVTS